ncbi:MAG: Fe-S cluster assembly protein SufD [Bacteroidales bacterium]|nr:Fe-S cluster assembly protein SufD [Bacteroidales bacterium]
MADFRYIPKKQLFDCSVELPGARKFFVWDGVPEGLPFREVEPLDCSVNFDIDTRVQNISYSPGEAFNSKAAVISPREGEITQVITVRVSPAALNARTAVDCPEGGKYSVLLCCHTVGQERFSTKEQIEIHVNRGASLDLVVMQNENSLSRHSSDYRIRLEEEASLSLNIVTIHAGNVSNRIHSLIAGKKAVCNLNGLYLADGQQIVDTDVVLVHNAQESVSRQLFKGILDDNSRSRFTGEVVVSPAAQKTEAYQANNNLLIADSARASSDPHLVIYADDVKCSHGSTAGSVGDAELFYMRSRGISEKEARILQQQAFAGAVLEKVSHPQLRERLACLVEKRLRGEDTLCAGCSKGCC